MSCISKSFHFLPLKRLSHTTMHRGAFCQFPFRWIYYYGSIKATGKETGKTYLCAMGWIFFWLKEHSYFYSQSFWHESFFQSLYWYCRWKLELVRSSAFQNGLHTTHFEWVLICVLRQGSGCENKQNFNSKWIIIIIIVIYILRNQHFTIYIS